VDLDLTIDYRPLLRTTRGIGLRGRNMRPVFRGLVPLLKEDIDQTFRRREGPQEKWAPLAPATVAAKARRKARRSRKAVLASIRRAAASGRPRASSSKSSLGRIRKAYAVDVGRQHLLATWKIPWAHVHQTGGNAGRHGASAIPRRTFGYVSDEFTGRAMNRMARYLGLGRL
jgi:phage gpG-like protein